MSNQRWPIIQSLEAVLSLLAAQESRRHTIEVTALSYGGAAGPPKQMPPSSAEAKSPRGFHIKTHEPCSSCLARDALDIVGVPRREPKTLMRLSFGCEECGGLGAVPLASKREKPRNVPGSMWARMGDPYSRHVAEAVGRAKERRLRGIAR